MASVNIPMSSQLARFLGTVGQIANGIGAFMLSADAVPFGLDAYDVGLAFVWTGSISTLIVIAIRGNWIPVITSGVGNEVQGTVATTTVTQETKNTP